MKVKRGLELLLAAATVLLALMAACSCVGIYVTGTSPENMTEAGVYIRDIYTPEIVREAFGRMAWAVWTWLTCLAAAVMARIAIPMPHERAGEMSAELRLKLMKRRIRSTPEMLAEQSRRRMAAWVLAVFDVLCAAPAVVYLADLSHFASRDLEAVMGRMLLHVAPWVAVAFAGVFVWAEYRERSLRREVKAASAAPRREPDAAKPARPAMTQALRAVLFVAAAALMIAGILNGGMYDVLVKAINLCTECVGLG